MTTVEHIKNTTVYRAEMHKDSNLVEMSKSHTSQRQFESTNNTVEYVKNTPVDRVEMPDNRSVVGNLLGGDQCRVG